jgi:hypothetical protein
MRRTAILLALSLGCTSTIGPLVTDVQRTAAGEFVVTRCRVRLSSMSGELATDGCESRVLAAGGAR